MYESAITLLVSGLCARRGEGVAALRCHVLAMCFPNVGARSFLEGWNPTNPPSRSAPVSVHTSAVDMFCEKSEPELVLIGFEEEEYDDADYCQIKLERPAKLEAGLFSS